MTPTDLFERWMAERRKPHQVPEDFSERVMRAVRAKAAKGRRAGTPPRRSASFAASVLVATVCATLGLAWHLTLVGALVLAVTGTAN